MLARLSRPIFNQSKRNGGHFFTVETAQFWKYMSIFGGGGFCLMAFENAERRLKPYEERIEFRERPNHMAGRNTKFPFSQEHPERNLFYNPAVNSNAFKGYEDGDNERRLYQAPAGYIHDPAKKAIPEAGSLEANIFNAEWRAEQGITDEEFDYIYNAKFAVKYTKAGAWRQPPHGH